MPKLPDFLRELSPAARSLFDERASRVRLAPHTPVLHRGAQTGGAYIVLSGRLRVYVISPDGHEATLYTLRPGETCVLALNCLFQDLRYPAWVVSEVRTEVAVVPGSVYRHLFATEPPIQNLTVQALSTAVFQLMAELESVHFRRLEHRLINLILLRANLGGIVRLTQQQMADHLGASREAVARLLQRLVAAGWIRTRRGAVELLDSEALASALRDDIDF